jgi:hypothetical protein
MSSPIVWDATAARLYETGVDHGVLYPMDTNLGTYPLGVAWNGLTTVTESPSGAEAKPLYADNTKYLNMVSNEELGGTIEAYTYPDEFGLCDGSAEPTPGLKLGQQGRKVFGLCYRTVLGNDVEGNSFGYKLHLIYGALAAPSEKAYGTINDSPEAIAFSWTFTTTPISVDTYRAVSSIVIDSTKVDSGKLTTLEGILFGSINADARLPLPDEVITILEEAVPDALEVACVPADEASGVAVAASVVLTFNNKISRESVVITSAAGVLKEVARSWDTDHEILTLDPTTNFAGGTTYIVTIAGVVDVYGQALDPEVINFATV